MGHWGPGILSNDSAADIRHVFLDLYDQGQDPGDIRRQLEKKFKEGDELVNNTDFWLALAYLQWKTGQLDQDVKEKAQHIIDNDIDLRLWKEMDADEVTIKKRRAALQKLRNELQSDNPEPRKRKKKSIPRTIFKKGECYAFKLRNGNYSAVVVLEDKNDDVTSNLIANTTINQVTIPTVEDILKGDLLLLPATPDIDKKPYREAIMVYMNVRYQKAVKRFIRIGEIMITRSYNDNYLLSTPHTHWDNLFELANQFLVDRKDRPPQRIKMSELLQKDTETPSKRHGSFLRKIIGWFSN